MTSSYEVDVRAELKDIAAVRNDPSVRMTCSPFGNVPGEKTCTVGSAVPWKGKSEDDLPPKVKAGLDNAKKIAADCEDVKGTGVYKGRVLTNRSICMMKAAGK